MSVSLYSKKKLEKFTETKILYSKTQPHDDNGSTNENIFLNMKHL